jgi:osmotically inducible protein OsmC
MQFASGLVGAGWEPEEMSVSAEVSFEIGFGIASSALTARVTVDRLTDDQIREIAERAKLNCPVSRALAAVDITLELPGLAAPADEAGQGSSAEVSMSSEE